MKRRWRTMSEGLNRVERTASEARDDHRMGNQPIPTNKTATLPQNTKTIIKIAEIETRPVPSRFPVLPVPATRAAGGAAVAVAVTITPVSPAAAVPIAVTIAVTISFTAAAVSPLAARAPEGVHTIRRRSTEGEEKARTGGRGQPQHVKHTVAPTTCQYIPNTQKRILNQLIEGTVIAQIHAWSSRRSRAAVSTSSPHFPRHHRIMVVGHTIDAQHFLSMSQRLGIPL